VSKAKVAFTIVAFSLLILLAIYSPPILSKTRFSTISLLRFPLRIALLVSRNTRDYAADKLYSKSVKENVELKNRLSEFSSEITKLGELEAENKRLKELLDFKDQAYESGIPARVIGIESAPLSKIMFIDRGKRDGIQTGMAVISKQGVVGKIIDAGPGSSKVILLGDMELRLGVIIQRTREQGLFIGGAGGRAKVIYLAPDSDAKEGDAIVSNSSRAFFPKGLLIGYVNGVKNEPISLYKYATVDIAVDYSRLEEVLCIK